MKDLPVHHLVGAPNFRDLGGIPTLSGRMVKKGLLYRSDDLYDLREKDLQHLKHLGLRSVVDFRTRQEVRDLPDQVPSTVVSQYHLPIDAGRLMAEYNERRPTAATTTGIMLSVYRQLAHDFTDPYRKFFGILLNHDASPLLFHCTAGKDRTGLAAALFLYAVGAGREEVMRDYLASVPRLEFKYQAGIDYDEIWQPMFTVKAEYLNAALEVIANSFGGMDRYLEETLAVDRGELKRLYTE